MVEVLVQPGDQIEKEQGLVTLESDKASMDVPSPAAGKVAEIAVKVGQEVAEGDLILTLEPAAGAEAEKTGADVEPVERQPPAEKAPEPATAPAAGKPAALPGGVERPPGDVAAEQTSPGEPPSTHERSAPTVSPPPDADLHAEVLVLGSGPGGYTAAFRAADLGKQVVLVERHPTLGGVCLNVGCIPSKALLHVARVVDEAAALAEHGVAFGEPRLDLGKLRGFKDSVVGRLTAGLATMAEKRRVRLVQGRGRFTSPRSLLVEGAEGETTISFDAAIVATGSRAIRLPGLPEDDPRILDSTSALELEEVPERLLVVGGGIIGLEMAVVYGALGSGLTIVELLDGLIPGCDRDLVRPLERRLKKVYGAEIHLETRVAGVEPRDDQLEVAFEGEKAPASARFDRVLVAVGRRPNSDAIGAEAAGLELDEKGFLPVDRQQRTNVPHLFAIGDVTGPPLLAHRATHQGKVAAEVAAGEKSGFDARVIPSVAYTDPEIAWVGLTETEAKERGTAYRKASFPWAASGRALGMGRDDGLTKLLFDPESRRLLGAGVTGVGAGDLIAELALAIEMDCEAADLALTVHPHPTLSETVAFAAEVFEGTVTDLYLPAGRTGGAR